jgi:hypothetical protein
MCQTFQGKPSRADNQRTIEADAEDIRIESMPSTCRALYRGRGGRTPVVEQATNQRNAAPS